MATQQSRSGLGTAVLVVFLLLLLAILVGVVFVLWAMMSAVNTPSQVVGSVTTEANRAISSAQQAVQSVTDPNHPPTGLTYDSEFASLQVWRVGERLPDASKYVFTLQAIRRREGAESADTAQYAVVHAELREPNETRLFGQVVRSDSDPHDYVLYKGENFRIGQAVYRVNWISQEAAATAAGVYRHPDAVTAPRKFEYD
jgi:hypothetical protein